MSEAKTEQVIKALANAMQAMPKVAKTGYNPHFKSNFANIDTILPTIKPILQANELMLVQKNVHAVDCAAIQTVVYHIKSGESLDLGTITVPMKKADPQAYGSAVTYARRYALVTVFLMETGDDDDGNNASRPPKDDLMSIKVRIKSLVVGLGFTDRDEIKSIVDRVRRYKDVAEDVDGLLVAEGFLKTLNKDTVIDFLNAGRDQ